MKAVNLIVCIALLVILFESIDARGGRGGGGRSGGSRGGSRSSRGSSSSRSSVARYSGYAAAAAAGYYVSGMTRYRTRYSHHSGYRSDPSVCYTSASGTLDNGTFTLKLGYFVCPYEETDDISDTYCCGDDDSQRCCGYWDNGGRVAGAVIGIICGVCFLIFAVIVVIKCCAKRKPHQPPVSYNVQSQKDSYPQDAYPAQPAYPAAPGYPAQSAYPAAPGYPEQPAYPPAQGCPQNPGYPVNQPPMYSDVNPQKTPDAPPPPY